MASHAERTRRVLFKEMQTFDQAQCAALLNTECDTNNSNKQHCKTKAATALTLTTVTMQSRQEKIAARKTLHCKPSKLLHPKHLGKHAFNIYAIRLSMQRKSCSQRLLLRNCKQVRRCLQQSVDKSNSKLCKLLAVSDQTRRSKTRLIITDAVRKLTQLSQCFKPTSGIVKIVLRCYEAGFKTTTQIRTHHFLPTLKPLEKNCGLVSKSLLKIRVSMVRFRPRPPHTHRSLAKGYGVFVCAGYFVNAVL